MDNLKSYFDAIDPRLLQHVTGKPGQFIQAFKAQTYLNEKAFEKRICGTNYPRKYYRTLKARTLKILQALMVMSISEGNNLVKKKYEICQKNFLVGQKFLNRKDRSEGLRLIKDAYKDAVDYDFAYFACELASILYHNHIYYDRNARKAEHYAAQVKYYLKAYTAEKAAEDYLYNIVQHMHKSDVETHKLQEAVTKIVSLQGTSIKYKVYEATINILCGLHCGDYEQIMASCKLSLHFLRAKQGVYSSHYHFFLKILGVAQIATHQYADAEETFIQGDLYAPKKSYNDYLLRFYKTLNALHAGQYQKAYDLYTRNKKCRIKVIKEQFAIIEAYLYFLAYTRHFHLDKPFRLGKYLNDTFKAQADKKGDNINILIAELLVYLARDRGKFIDRVEAIKNYSYRYLKGEDTKRAKWFIRILCTLPRANFHPIALKRLAKKQIENLEQSNIRMGENFAIEIIPFEDLLEMILTHLERKVA